MSKKGFDSLMPKSYRPISITSCLARLFERLLLVRLKSFLNYNNILISSQSGFRCHRQTKDNIIFLTQKFVLKVMYVLSAHRSSHQLVCTVVCLVCLVILEKGRYLFTQLWQKFLLYWSKLTWYFILFSKSKSSLD